MSIDREPTAVDWLAEEFTYKTTNGIYTTDGTDDVTDIVNKAKEMEKNNIDNKVIHFAEWLTKKHTTTLITLYEHFEEEFYSENI